LKRSFTKKRAGGVAQGVILSSNLSIAKKKKKQKGIEIKLDKHSQRIIINIYKGKISHP
jgi:hypothetical protein